MMNADIVISPSRAHLKLGLAFQDPVLEKAYLEYAFLKNRKLLVLGLVMLACITLLQAPLDLLAQPAQRHIIQFFRFAVWIPTLAVGIVIIPRSKNPTVWTPLSFILGCIQGILYAILAPPFGILSFELVLFLTLTFLIGQYFFTGMPFRWSVAVATVTHLSQTLVILIHYPENPWLLIISLSIPLSGSMIGFCAYRFERVSRESFFAQNLLQVEYSHRLATEQERIRWLETMTGFLRHELKNAMTGIGSSLDLAVQTSTDHECSKYLGRAKHSFEFMRRFLAQAAEATSLETALAEQELDPVNLSLLTEGRIRDYCEEETNRSFVGNIEPDIWVLGNADRLVQMLDKLTNNALEHGTAESPIDFVLQRHQGRAILMVKDIGEPLPSDLDRIFEPFTSNKLRQGRDNLGLGLYVVRVIANRFGGTVRARRLKNPDGAELIVELPCCTENHAAN